MSSDVSSPPNTKQFIFAIIGVGIMFASLTYLAGLPSSDTMVNFIIGILFLIAITTFFGLVSWHLLLRPLPLSHQTVHIIEVSPFTRSMVALLLTLATIGISAGGVWDEVWHGKYGVPFGEDLFWRPHLMIYFSFLTLVGVSVWSWFTLFRRGKGTLQQRFHGNPLVGVTFLAGAYTLYAVVADPIWHSLYGSDIAPWSVPHLLILIMILIMAILGVSYHKTLVPKREWRTSLQATWRDLLMVFILAGALLPWTLIFTIQWYAARAGSADQLSRIGAYPDWLFGLFITFLAMLFGGFALHTTRQVGSATIVGILAILLRFGLDTGFAGVRSGVSPFLLMTGVMLALDVCYAVWIMRVGKRPPLWISGVVIGVTFTVISFTLMPRLFPFIEIQLIQLPVHLIASVIAGIAGIWFAKSFSESGVIDEIATVEIASADVVLPPLWLNMAIYTVFVVGLVLFVITASPPV